MYNITLIDGDGIGPEITKSVVDIIDAAGVKINWDEHLAG
ncbi:NAD-dependent isocitrate dehydrogenase, partial [bacterium]|nr:NAD-dependent isocitrate dehydrogenase [bacterium]